MWRFSRFLSQSSLFSNKLTRVNSFNVNKIQSRFASSNIKHIRNVAIVAHVDHGKTTMVDQMLKTGGSTLTNERLMDSIDLERERGITIMSKCTRIEYKDMILNIVDTPGHADFGGEVERILSMVDGVVLVVDAAEGAMSQTKFVLTKALRQNLRPVVVINKMDREDRRTDGEVENELFDMFVALDANDEQLEFPILYASGKQGWAVSNTKDLNLANKTMHPLFDTIISYVPPPHADIEAPFSMSVIMISYDQYVGHLSTGRIHSGKIKIGDPIKVLNHESKQLEIGKVTKLYVTRGTTKSEITEALAGDIVTIGGVCGYVTDTICNPEVTESLPSVKLDPPTISMTFSVNDSPVSGKEGQYVTSANIKDRLEKEIRNNVAVSLSPSQSSEALDVNGRGELQLAILIEEMRREGYEFSVSSPRVLFKYDKEKKQKLEPIEEIMIDVDSEYSGMIMEKVSARGGEVVDFKEINDKTRLVFRIPSRGLIGYRSEIKTDTRGSGVLNSTFFGYAPYNPSSAPPIKGKLISTTAGKATAYALNMAEDRGVLFVKPGDQVYEGMIVGEHSRPIDLDINPTKEKKLTNVRSTGAEENIRLSPIRELSLEDVIAYIADDEIVEITPKNIRMRKQLLDAGKRKRIQKQDRRELEQAQAR